MRYLLALIFMIFPLVARAEEPLVWGGDQEGGGPYIFPSPDDRNRLTGFEVELADLLAGKLGRTAKFQQNEWTQLPALLQRRDMDCILNGYEWSDNHLARMIATRPYFVYHLRLVVRKGDSIRWESLQEKKKVGILAGSAAERFLTKEFPNAELIRYQGTTDALKDLSIGRLDASVQDDPPTVFYASRFPELSVVDRPMGKGHYVIYLRPESGELKGQLDRAIGELFSDGTLEKLYRRYGIWNEYQQELSVAPESITVAKKPRSEVVREALPLLARSAAVTALLACGAMPLAIALGFCVALSRLYGPRPVRGAAMVYVEIVRGTPLMLQLFFLYFVLPSMGWTLPATLAALLGLAINYSAYEAEIHRAAILGVPSHQISGALALGAGPWTILTRVVLPQALRPALPAMTNDFVALFKDTSVCSAITIVELSKNYYIQAQNSDAVVELALVTAALYLTMSLPAAYFARRLERASSSR